MVAARGAMRIAIAATAALLTLAGCGGDSGPKAPEGVSQSAFERQLRDAQSPDAAQFPKASGQTLQELASSAQPGAQVGLATSVFVPGTNRLAFGLIDSENRFVYGKTAVFVARSPAARARGPYLAPADSLITEGRYRSRQAASEESGIAAIYAAQVPFSRPGRNAVLVLTNSGGQMIGATTEVRVARDSPIPAVGERPPAVDTDTVASAAGGIEAIDTRIPPAPELHEENFKDVLGKQPVALLFATPQLCQSRVCGPVVDIALQLNAKYGEQVAFIHQEVYVDNELEKGLREPLRAFNLQTEPWLFTVDQSGRVATRLEGSFGLRAFEQAVQAALR
jgi:hypothetical protein